MIKNNTYLVLPALMALLLLSVFTTSCDKEKKFNLDDRVTVDLLFNPQDCSSTSAKQPDFLTKATGEGHGNSLFDEEVKTLQLFAFNANGVLDAYTVRSGSPLPLKSGDTPVVFSLTVSKGQKEIYAVANSHNVEGFAAVKSKAELEALVTSLANEDIKNFFMVGRTEVNAQENSSATIILERMVSRVELHSIRTSFSGGFAGMPLTDAKAYLINVNPTAVVGTGLGTGTMLNSGELKSTDIATLTMQNMLSSTLGNINASGNNTTQYFYCYPNTNASAKTMLVIEGKIDGEKCYYPIVISDDIPTGYKLSRNTSYVVSDVIITRFGSDTPSTPVEVGTLSLTITVKDWTTRTYSSITI